MLKFLIITVILVFCMQLNVFASSFPADEDIQYAPNPDCILVLVNKYHRLSRDFSPKTLINIEGGHYLRGEAAIAFYKMRYSMGTEGLFIIVRSTYRSFATQQYLHSRSVRNNGLRAADMMLARPGHSEHQTGLAVDIVQLSAGSMGLGAARFQDTRQYEWLRQNAYRYGFILRYPNGYTHITGYIYEPWHWRYIGVSAAAYMRENDIATLECYFELTRGASWDR